MLDFQRRSEIEKAIAGALANAIHSHGPITLENRASAAKRVYVMLRELGKHHPEWVQAGPSNLEWDKKAE